MLHGSDLISIMPRLMMVGDLVRGTLRVLPLPITTPDRPAGLILSRDRPLSAPAQIFISSLRLYVGELADRGITLDITHSNSDTAKSYMT